MIVLRCKRCIPLFSKTLDTTEVENLSVETAIDLWGMYLAGFAGLGSVIFTILFQFYFGQYFNAMHWPPVFAGGSIALVATVWRLKIEIENLNVETAIDLWLKQLHGFQGLEASFCNFIMAPNLHPKGNALTPCIRGRVKYNG